MPSLHKGASAATTCAICANKDYFQLLVADLSAVQVQRSGNGAWQRSKLRIPRATVTTVVGMMCCVCGELQPAVPPSFPTLVSKRRKRLKTV